MGWRLLLVSALGAACYLDRTAAFQVMVSRPLVAGALTGAIFGNFTAGAMAGAVIELLYIARLPVGASVPPDDTGAAIFAAAGVSAVLPGRFDPLNLPDGIAGAAVVLLLLSVGCAEAGKAGDRFVRRVNCRIARVTIEGVERGAPDAVEHGLYAGLTLFAAVGAAQALLFSGAGLLAGRWLSLAASEGTVGSFSVLLPVIPLLGAASILSCSRTEKGSAVYYACMAVTFAAVMALRMAQR